MPVNATFQTMSTLYIRVLFIVYFMIIIKHVILTYIKLWLIFETVPRDKTVLPNSIL